MAEIPLILRFHRVYWRSLVQKDRNLAYLFVSHDLSVVEYVSDRLMVMYLGKIVEIAPSDEIYRTPRHPYTEGLLSAIPKYKAGAARSGSALKGAIPSPANPPSGCVFHPRCVYAQSICKAEVPALRSTGLSAGASAGAAAGAPAAAANGSEGVTTDSAVACHRSHELSLSGYSE